MGLDTNVVVPYLTTQDDPKQALIAPRLMEKTPERETPTL